MEGETPLTEEICVVINKHIITKNHSKTNSHKPTPSSPPTTTVPTPTTLTSPQQPGARAPTAMTRTRSHTYLLHDDSTGDSSNSEPPLPAAPPAYCQPGSYPLPPPISPHTEPPAPSPQFDIGEESFLQRSILSTPAREALLSTLSPIPSSPTAGAGAPPAAAAVAADPKAGFCRHGAPDRENRSLFQALPEGRCLSILTSPSPRPSPPLPLLPPPPVLFLPGTIDAVWIGLKWRLPKLEINDGDADEARELRVAGAPPPPTSPDTP